MKNEACRNDKDNYLINVHGDVYQARWISWAGRFETLDYDSYYPSELKGWINMRTDLMINNKE